MKITAIRIFIGRTRAVAGAVEVLVPLLIGDDEVSVAPHNPRETSQKFARANPVFS